MIVVVLWFILGVAGCVVAIACSVLGRRRRRLRAIVFTGGQLLISIGTGMLAGATVLMIATLSTLFALVAFPLYYFALDPLASWVGRLAQEVRQSRSTHNPRHGL